MFPLIRPLTTGVDSGAAYTGGAGNDTFNANVASLGSLDVINGGAGTDTLNIVDSVALPTLGGLTASSIETVNISVTGAVGTLAAAAGATTPAVAQVIDWDFAANTYASGAGPTYTVTIAGVAYTTSAAAQTGTAASTAIQSWAVIKPVLDQHIGNSVTFDDTNFKITSKNAGVALPAITVKALAASAGAVSLATGTAQVANTVATGTVATKQVLTLVLSDAGTASPATSVALAVGDVVKLSIGGLDYPVVSSGTTATTLGNDIAAAINGVLGAGSANSEAGSVVITALTAGTALPTINLNTAANASALDATDWTATVTQSIANQALNAVAASAAAIAAPTGTTTLVSTSTGFNSNTTAPTTAAYTVTGKAVQTSGGAAVTITATDSVRSNGATGAVVIKTGVPSTLLVGAEPSDTSTATTASAAGVYVTGGTSVTITETATANATNVKVGGAPYAKDAVNETTLPKTNGNLATSPTGDVSITNQTNTTSATGFVTAAFGTGTAKVYMNGGTTATVKGAGVTTITDVNTFGLLNASNVTAYGTSKLATVNLAGLSGDATILSDAITTVNVSDQASARTVNVTGNTGANAGAITYGLSNAGASGAKVTLANATATSINIKSGAASVLTDINSLNNSASFVTLNSPLATSITMTNSLPVDLGDLTSAGTGKVATIAGAGATGSISAMVGAVPLQGLSITTGSGADTITVKSGDILSANATSAAVLSVNLGAGNDVLKNESTSVHAVVGATFDGGAGNDTVYATLINSGNGGQFVNFETLGLDVASGTMDATLVSGITGLRLITGGSTYTGVTPAQSLAVNSTTTGTTTLTFTGVAGAADGYTVNFGSVNTGAAPTTGYNTAAGTLAADGIENFTIVSGGTKAWNSITLGADTSANTVVVSGASNLDLTFASGFGSTLAPQTGVTLIDGSAATGKLAITTTNVVAALAGLTVKGGSAADTFTLSADSTIVLAGAGDDTITSGSGGGVFTGGAGVNTYNIALSVGVAPVVTITDLKSKDVIDFAGTIAAAGTLGAKVDVSAAITLATALEVANGTTGSLTTAALSWFQYGGNTYIYSDLPSSASASGTLDGNDNVVMLTGLVDLTGSAYTTAGTLTMV